MRGKASLRLPKLPRALDSRAEVAILRKGDIVEVVNNPRVGCKRTLKYINEPAEVVISINRDTILLKMYDGLLMTVDRECIKEI